MKIFLCITIIIVQILLTYAEVNSTYTTEYDGFDIREVMRNERLLTSYVNCLLDKGPCTAEGKELKKNLPDAAQNDCKKCTQRQKENADLMIQYMEENRPDDWNKLELKYDANETYGTVLLDGDKNVTNGNQTSAEV
ncbi:ejaculatory bulb-specific protein 3 [Manduca sexta]|uniref:ejaculatory bulb-specific protein 3 n=1 Tax=Manduca sexta TaxID=7130 RepID=UPI00188E8C0F|nr:ejaculatory bulb-specific protein 3 [Manduca sexta]